MGLHFFHICRMQDIGQGYGCVQTVKYYHILYIYITKLLFHDYIYSNEMRGIAQSLR